jgi:Uma2 family endonuclease
MVAVQPKIYSKEEYLALEEKAEFKNEYHDGEIIAMTGGTFAHNEIAVNFGTYFKFSMKGKGYKISLNDVKLCISDWKRYVYPDIMIFENSPIYEGENTTIVTNPIIIIEVLSDSTRNYDRSEKFKYYRSIPTLKEYILIDQYEPYIEHFIKQSENEWLLKTYDQKTQNLTLASMEFQISFNDIYEGINFESK